MILFQNYWLFTIRNNFKNLSFNKIAKTQKGKIFIKVFLKIKELKINKSCLLI